MHVTLSSGWWMTIADLPVNRTSATALVRVERLRMLLMLPACLEVCPWYISRLLAACGSQTQFGGP